MLVNFTGYQSTSTFLGKYNKAYFAFERRFNDKLSVESTFPEQNITYIQPSIPPEASSIENSEQIGGGVSDTIRNILGRFRRPTNSHDTSNIDTVVNSSLSMEENRNIQSLESFTEKDVYIKTCDLRKDGASINSLSQIEATRQSSPCSYFQFAKVLGAVQSGFSPGITLEDYEKAYPIYGFDLSNSGESWDSMVSTAARDGYYRLSTLFSGPIPKPITAIYFFEYSGTLTVDAEGLVKRSFVV